MNDLLSSVKHFLHGRPPLERPPLQGIVLERNHFSIPRMAMGCKDTGGAVGNLFLKKLQKGVRAVREPPLLDSRFLGNDEPARMAQSMDFLQRCPPKLPPEKLPCPLKPLPPLDPVTELPPPLRGVLKTPLCCAVEGGLETCARGA